MRRMETTFVCVADLCGGRFPRNKIHAGSIADCRSGGMFHRRLSTPWFLGVIQYLANAPMDNLTILFIYKIYLL